MVDGLQQKIWLWRQIGAMALPVMRRVVELQRMLKVMGRAVPGSMWHSNWPSSEFWSIEERAEYIDVRSEGRTRMCHRDVKPDNIVYYWVLGVGAEKVYTFQLVQNPVWSLECWTTLLRPRKSSKWPSRRDSSASSAWQPS
jgi:hypothetical protein